MFSICAQHHCVRNQSTRDDDTRPASTPTPTVQCDAHSVDEVSRVPVFCQFCVRAFCFFEIFKFNLFHSKNKIIDEFTCVETLAATLNR